MPKVQEDYFDVRKVERSIADGHVTREQYDAYLASLEDCAEDAEESSVRMIGHDRGGRTSTLGEEHPHEEEEG